MRHENLPAVDDLRQGNRPVLDPVLDGFGAVDEDDEVVLLAFVVDFGLLGVAAGHGGWDRAALGGLLSRWKL